MIIDEISAIKRLESPLNLINRLKAATSHKNDAMQLFTGPPKQQSKVINPFERKAQEPVAAPVAEIPEQEETTLDTILKDSDSQIKLGLAHDKALSLLINSVAALESKIDDVSAGKLPAAITAASKVVESIRKERFEASRINKDREVHYHFYTPERKKLADFEVIEVQ